MKTSWRSSRSGRSGRQTRIGGAAPALVAPLVLGVLAALAVLTGGVAPVSAQEAPPLAEDQAAALAAFYNRATTTRLAGETRIAPGAEVTGDVASLGGPLTVAGHVLGDLLVINGDVFLEPGARIDGALVVVGGRVEGPAAAVSGGITVYREALRFRREEGRIIALGPSRPPALSAGGSTWFGRTDLLLAVNGSYNRVEGLPVTFGPRVELGHSNPTVFDARLEYRTRSGLRIHPEEFGYHVGVEQFLGGHRSVSVGASLESAIDPIEDNGVSDTENSLSTFILHRDYRDHYEREGWGAFVRLLGRTRPFEARIEYRDETHRSIGPGEPWSLLSNDDPWRPQPQVAEGDLRSIVARLQWDTRNDRTAPATGWLVELEVEQGLEGALRVLTPAPVLPGEPPTLVERPVEAEFTAMRLDARRFLRMGPRTRLALRAVVAGSPDDGPLPPQRQHLLGGEGGLPGYERFRFDCGARAEGTIGDRYPYYGCDRVALLQGELRLGLFDGQALNRRLGLDVDLLGAPELVLFADAGRAWIEAESLRGRRETGPRALRWDAGLGLRLGPLGAYLAVPLSADGDGANFFIRVGPRI